MKTLYLECNMGAAGDMLTAALLELLDEPNGWMEKMNGMGLEGVGVSYKKTQKCGINGTHVEVSFQGKKVEEADGDAHGHAHGGGHAHESGHTHGGGLAHESGHGHHHSMKDIEGMIGRLAVSDGVKENAVAVYRLIAEAESHAHGKPVTEVHFHEVGMRDAIADVVGACLLMEELKPDKVVASPIHLGSGTVRCAHGELPVPAPATAYILRGVPVYQGNVKGELCTPTGAAILRHFVDEFGPMPSIIVEKIGYGMGGRDFEVANCVRAFWGEPYASQADGVGANDEVVELSCNLDDMTGEAVAFACETLLGQGALDVFTVPVQMKKGRPGVLLTCLCGKGESETMARLILRHTTTFGVRERVCRRYVLDRRFDKVRTGYGDVTVKVGEGYGVEKSKPEYEDVSALARSNGVSLIDVMNDKKD